MFGAPNRSDDIPRNNTATIFSSHVCFVMGLPSAASRNTGSELARGIPHLVRGTSGASLKRDALVASLM